MSTVGRVVRDMSRREIVAPLPVWRQIRQGFTDRTRFSPLQLTTIVKRNNAGNEGRTALNLVTDPLH